MNDTRTPLLGKHLYDIFGSTGTNRVQQDLKIMNKIFIKHLKYTLSLIFY